MSLSFPRPAKSLAWFESLLAKQGAVGAGSKLEKGVGAETAIGSFVSYRKDALHCRGGGKYLILHDRDTLELLREALDKTNLLRGSNSTWSDRFQQQNQASKQHVLISLWSVVLSSVCSRWIQIGDLFAPRPIFYCEARVFLFFLSLNSYIRSRGARILVVISGLSNAALRYAAN